MRHLGGKLYRAHSRVWTDLHEVGSCRFEGSCYGSHCSDGLAVGKALHGLVGGIGRRGDNLSHPQTIILSFAHLCVIRSSKAMYQFWGTGGLLGRREKDYLATMRYCKQYIIY